MKRNHEIYNFLKKRKNCVTSTSSLFLLTFFCRREGKSPRTASSERVCCRRLDKTARCLRAPSSSLPQGTTFCEQLLFRSVVRLKKNRSVIDVDIFVSLNKPTQEQV
ncbi:unnamed protein product [Amoebophrya sp. A120]|nr:unnamed protein product [Amoebophrya sp. A120]|eukprot:GSA120T00018027001.1